MFESQSPPLMEPEWETAEGPSSVRWRDLETPFDDRIGTPRQRPIHSSHPSSPKSQRVASNRPPVGRRILRTVTRFLVAVFIGVSATLAWQSDAARNMMAVHAPSLASLLSVSATTSPMAAMSADPTQQLGPLASSLDVIRRSVEQLAAKQDQMVQNIALLRAVEEDIREKMSPSPSPAPAEQATFNPQPKPQQPKVQPPVFRAPPPAAALSR